MKINVISASLVAGLLVVCMATSVFAKTVTVGDGSGTDVEVKGQVTKIECNYGTTSPQITIYDSGTTKTASYQTATATTVAWCRSKVEAVADKLVDAGLAGGYSLENMVSDTSQNRVNLMLDEGDADTMDQADKNNCTAILPQSWCEGGEGINEILNLALNVMTMGVGILATVGIVISGIQWMTARDNESQIVKAKSRLFNIVIGIALWGIMYLLLAWLTPGGLDF